MADNRRRVFWLILLALLFLGGGIYVWQHDWNPSQIAHTPPRLERPGLRSHAPESQPAGKPPEAATDEAGATINVEDLTDAEPATEPADETVEEVEEGTGFRATVAGRVVDSKGERVAGADVHIQYSVLTAGEVSDVRELSYQHSLRVQSDDRGAYSFTLSEHHVGEDGVVVFSSLQPGTLEARIRVPGQDIDEYKLTMHILEGQENNIGEIRLRWAAGKVE